MEEVQKYPAIYNKFSKDYKNKFIRMNIWKAIGEKFGLDAAEEIVPTTVFAVNKPCWCIVCILCQAQVIVTTNCGLHYFLHQSNIRSYCPSEYSPLCYISQTHFQLFASLLTACNYKSFDTGQGFWKGNGFMSQGLSSKISSPTLTKGSQETRSAIDVRHFVSEYRA